MNYPKVCFDRFLPKDCELKHVEGVQRIALLRDKIWPNGATINIRLIGGSRGQHNDVALAAEEWQRYANIDFRINNAMDAAIRITFNPSGGAWSMLGMDALQVSKRQPTMNLGFEDGGTYLHEFGHALGAIHEHQNPEDGINWNRANVINDLSGPPNNWDMATIENNMFAKYSQSQTNGTQVDTNSIMLYQIPAHWTTDGFQSKQNSTLSQTDKAFISKIYSKIRPIEPIIPVEPITPVNPVQPVVCPQLSKITLTYKDGSTIELSE